LENGVCEGRVNLMDGLHNIQFNITDEAGNSASDTIEVFLDTIAPRIYRTGPRSRSFSNGSDFYVQFYEKNLKEVKLIINGNLAETLNIKEDCFIDRKRYGCYAQTNLSEYEEQEVEYWFNVSDDFNEVSSRTLKINVDSIAPRAKVIFPEENEDYIRRVPFKIEVNESNFDSISYIYEYRGYEREINLCSRLYNGLCERTRIFVPGKYNLTIKVEDKAGNFDLFFKEFDVSSFYFH
jgi:hypothetical protein